MKFRELRVLQYTLLSCSYFCRSGCVYFCTQGTAWNNLEQHDMGKRIESIPCGLQNFKVVHKQSEEICYALLNQKLLC